MKKHVFDIKLMNRPISGASKGEHNSDGGWLDNWTKSFVIVNAGALGKTAKDPAGFVSVEGPIGMKFVSEYPLPSNNIGLEWTLNQVPGMILMKSSTFGFHGLAPIGVGQGIPVERGMGESTSEWRAARGCWKPDLPRVAMPWELVTGGIGTAPGGSEGPCLM
jgi:hypothetical protein